MKNTKKITLTVLVLLLSIFSYLGIHYTKTNNVMIAYNNQTIDNIDYTSLASIKNYIETADVNKPCSRALAAEIIFWYSGADTYKKTDTFTDVNSDGVSWAYQTGIVTGRNETTFDPDGTVTRGQFITMLWRYAGRFKEDATFEFADVNPNMYYYTPINWAYNHGITNGTDMKNRLFSPDREITIKQVLTFIYRFRKKNLDPKLTLENIKYWFYLSKNIDDDIKDYLWNDGILFKDWLEMVKGNEELEIYYLDRFKQGIFFDTYDESDKLYESTLGYYEEPNIIKNVNYLSKDNWNYKDTLSHELIHFLSYRNGFLGEALAELGAYEYYDCPVDSYFENIAYAKKIMEIFGTNVVKKYIFTSSRELINEASNYLSSNEIEEFESFLKFPYILFNTDTIDKLLAKIYKEKYHKNIKNDELFKLIDDYQEYSDNSGFYRYYLNTRKQSISYYQVRTKIINQVEMCFKDAYNKGLITFDEYNNNKLLKARLSYNDFVNTLPNTYVIHDHKKLNYERVSENYDKETIVYDVYNTQRYDLEPVKR